MMRIVCFAVILFLALPAYAQRVPLTLDLAEDHVDITTGFDGTRLVVYGTTSSRGDIIISLFGPERTMVVRRKDRVMGAWINAQSVEFHRVPGYYDYARTNSIRNMPPEIGRKFGLSALDFYPEERLPDTEARRFREALIRNKQTQGLFPLQGRPVQMISDGFYKAVFPLPANMPTGLYQVEASLIEGGAVRAQAQRQLQVGQVGFSARVYLFAQDHSWLYALFTIGVALFAGWGAFTFLRRD